MAQQVAKDAEWLHKNVLQPAAASNGKAPEKPHKFLDRVKSLRTTYSNKEHSRPPAKSVSFPAGSQVCPCNTEW